MSLSLIAFQPAIELPSNMKPSVSWSSSTIPAHMDRCCHLPLGSVNRRSTHSISSSLIRLKILPASLIVSPLDCPRLFPGGGRGPQMANPELSEPSSQGRPRASSGLGPPVNISQEQELVGAAACGDEHSEQHSDRARHPDLALGPQTHGRPADPDRLGEIALGLVAER